MAKNELDMPEVARARQDVVASVRRESTGHVHYGRGGAANFAKADRERTQASDNEMDKGERQGWAERGMGILNRLSRSKERK